MALLDKVFMQVPDQRWIILQSISKSSQTSGVMYTSPARPVVNNITKYSQVRPDQQWIILQSISKSGQTSGE